MNDKINQIYKNFIYKRTYSRWIETENRRETWNETVIRYACQMEKTCPASLSTEFYDAINDIKNFSVMPSMRLLWSAGKAVEENNLAAYNCAYVSMNHPDKFAEMLYVLMHGVGVGFSVERQYVGELPAIPEDLEQQGLWVIEDSKLGWKNAYGHLIERLYHGRIPEFDYSKIRPKGARLRTFGGRASGPQPLKDLIEYTTRVFKGAKGRKLNSLEVHDLCCMVANCVVVGGVRRSACISFSNLSDQRMKHAKDGQFWVDHPQRAMANNSIAYTEKPDSAMFMEEWLNLMRSGSGERGIANVQAIATKAKKFGRPNPEDIRANPCFEALLHDEGLCNLTEVIVEATDTKETLKQKIRSAVLLGELQSLLTYFPNISTGWTDKAVSQRLLGVSLSGTCDNKYINRVSDKARDLLAELKEYAHECDKEFSDALGIDRAKQITLTKPSGTVSQMVNCSSGIHPRYSDYYIRRVRVNSKDPVARYLIDKGIPYNPEVGQEKESCNTFVFDFPIKSPRGCVTRNQWTAIEQLEYWYMINKYWCDGNPSCTIYVGEDEWVEVGAWVYKNWKNICGLSFLPRDSSVYQLAPYEEITSDQYHEACKLYKTVDLDFDSELRTYEIEDNTQGAQELACSGGSCELR